MTLRDDHGLPARHWWPLLAARWWIGVTWINKYIYINIDIDIDIQGGPENPKARWHTARLFLKKNVVWAAVR